MSRPSSTAKVVGEQLHRDAQQQRLELGLGVRDPDHVVGQAGGQIGIGDGDDGAAAGLDLLDGREVLGQEFVVRDDHDARHRRVDQGERAVLQLGGLIRLGVDVGDLLQLLGAFAGDRPRAGAAE